MDSSLRLDIWNFTDFARCDRVNGTSRFLLHNNSYLVERASSTLAIAQRFPRQQIHNALNHRLYLHLFLYDHRDNHGSSYTYRDLRPLWRYLWNRDRADLGAIYFGRSTPRNFHHDGDLVSYSLIGRSICGANPYRPKH